MISLQQIINKYKSFGVSDLDIIRKFFIENKAEAEAVVMLTQLCNKQINYLHLKNEAFKMDVLSCKSVLCNPELSEDDRLKLFDLVTKFTYFMDLDNKELKEAKRIFNTNKVYFCPNYFRQYIKEKGILKNDNDEYDEDALKGLIERRDN